MIENGKKYKVVSDSAYLKEKYGEDITITIEDKASAVLGFNWEWDGCAGTNWAAKLYVDRAKTDNNLLPRGNEWYGKIGAFGEVVHGNELGEKVEE